MNKSCLQKVYYMNENHENRLRRLFASAKFLYNFYRYRFIHSFHYEIYSIQTILKINIRKIS